MKSFRYTATDAQNESVHGVVEADTVEAARRQLLAAGLTAIELEGISPDDDGQFRGEFSSDEAAELADVIADVAEAKIPFDVGLIAAAREIKTRRVATALRQIASRISAGSSLVDAVESLRMVLPRHIAGLIRVAGATESVGEVLAELSGFHHRRREMWREMWMSLAYPLLVSFLAVMVLAFSLMCIVPPIREMVVDLEMKLSGLTRFVFSLSQGAPGLIVAMVAIPIIVLIGRLGVGESGWRRIVYSMPFIGPACRWSGITELIRMVALFLRCQMPLDEAMNLASVGVSDAYVGELATNMSRRLEAGEKLGAVMNSTPGFPKLVSALVDASAKTDDLQAAMLSAANALEGLTSFRLSLIRAIVPMFSFLFVVVFTVFIVTGIFTPILQLINLIM